MSRKLTIALLIVSLVFVAIGIAMVANGAEGGWPALLFFLMCAGVFITQLRPELLVSVKPEPPAMLAQRFPGPVDLTVSQRKMVMVLVGALIFAGVSLWYLFNEQPSLYGRIVLWAGVAFLGAGIPVILCILVMGAGLRLDAEGFRVRQAWRRYRTRWTDVSPFEVATLPIPLATQSVLAVIYDDATAKGSKLAAVNVGLTGRNAALPDTYNFSHAELAELMNLWRERALATAGRTAAS